jgi:hypothetical protein
MRLLVVALKYQAEVMRLAELQRMSSSLSNREFSSGDQHAVLVGTGGSADVTSCIAGTIGA